MILFSNGCSFLTERPKDGVTTHTGKLLAQHYGYDLANLAMGGRGNDRISFTTKLWFTKNTNKDVFAVIGWSSSNRNDYVTDDGWKKGRIPGLESTWRTWKVGEQLRFVTKQPGWSIEQQAEMRFLDHVLDMQNFFKLNKIPYVMYSSLINQITSTNKDFEAMREQVDTRRFFNFGYSHFEHIMSRKTIVTPADPHPSAEGHQIWTNELKDFIDANNLRSI